ncbi:hypothetical protein ACR42D_01250 [Desulfovibrio caledoniensis]
MSIELEIVVAANSLTDLEVWGIVCDVLSGYNAMPDKFHAYGKAYAFQGATSLVKRHGIFPRTGEYEIQSGTVTAWKHQFVSIKSLSPVPKVPWVAWVDAFKNKSIFLQGWLSDSEYTVWQNCTDIEHCTRHGHDLSKLSTVPNSSRIPSAPSLLIDISGNPGRRTLRMGIVEAVGNIMWLGPEFWERSGANKASVLSEGWIDSWEEADGVVVIKVAEAVFTAESSPELQHRLRRLLYPYTWNIPVKWRKYKGWRPVEIPSEGQPSSYEDEEIQFPIVLEIHGEKGGKKGIFRLTRKSRGETDMEFNSDQE